MKTTNKIFVLLVINFCLLINNTDGQTLISTPEGTKESISPSACVYIGKAGGITYTYTNSSWDSSSVVWGVSQTLTKIINGNNSQPPNTTCSGLSDLIYNTDLSNLTKGKAIFTGSTNYKYIDTSKSYTISSVKVRLTLTTKTTDEVAIAMEAIDGKIIIPVKQNFKSTLLIEAYSPDNAVYFSPGIANTWIPAVELFDYLHTDPNSSICTSFDDQSFYSLF
jgi:hypothetical protein